MGGTFSDLHEKVALVTGAAGGIGVEIAAALHEQAAHVILCDRHPDELRTAAERVKSRASGTSASNARVETYEVDVAHEPSVAEAVDAAKASCGRVDIVVNCAGVRGPSAPATELSLDDWNSVLNTVLTGSWLVSRYAARHLATNGGGAIVNIGSTAGRLPRLGQAAYCVAKAGVEHLTRVMALELAPDKVRVNAVCPGATRTPFLEFASVTEGRSVDDFEKAIISGDSATHRAGIPLARLASPADTAAAVLFLSSDSARHITGQILFVDGGETML